MAVVIGRVVWPGPVGIGAGIIKGAEAFKDFGKRADSLEVGSITKQMRLGNNGQTVWKYAKEQALRHNAGLPNPGVLKFVELFRKAQYQVSVPWGLNVAVSPGITNGQVAADDVEDTASLLLESGLRPDWMTFNISSPDTEDPIDLLCEPNRVRLCLEGLKQAVSLYNVPLFLKVGSNLPPSRLKEVALLLLAEEINGMIVGNALPDMKGLVGGWCGEPVRAYMLSTLTLIKQFTAGKVPVIAVGGIISGKHVQEAFTAGAAAVQVVSATLFRGRDAAVDIKREYEIIAAKAYALS